MNVHYIYLLKECNEGKAGKHIKKIKASRLKISYYLIMIKCSVHINNH